jgi:hypothetical protein
MVNVTLPSSEVSDPPAGPMWALAPAGLPAPLLLLGSSSLHPHTANPNATHRHPLNPALRLRICFPFDWTIAV